MKEVIVYTDGGCRGSKTGGWGVVLRHGSHSKTLKGGEYDTTNNRMELTAVLKSMLAMKTTDVHLKIHSDSAYVVNCFLQGWYKGWQKKGWKNSKGQPVENRDLWEAILEVYQYFKKVDFIKVKGHSGVPDNELCDQLANEAMDELEAAL